MKKEVVLASGATSDYYIDGRMVAVCPEGAHLIGEVLYDHLREFEFNAIGGLATGAIPLVTSAVISCYHHGRDVEGFWVRDNPKSHGAQRRIEGNLPESARAVIIDDVITSGGSALKAAQAVQEAGGQIVRVVAVVDRQSGAQELLAEHGHRYDWIFNRDDLLAVA